MKATLGSCVVGWDGRELLIENENFIRKWACEGGKVAAVSFRDKATQIEWVPHLGGAAPTPPPGFHLGRFRAAEAKVVRGRALPMEEECLTTDLNLSFDAGSLALRFRVFEGSSGVLMQTGIFGDSLQAPDVPHQEEAVEEPDRLESLQLQGPHLLFTQVSLQDRTDVHNELVQETHWLLHPNESDLLLTGNLFILEDTISHAGLVFLKHAPLPTTRPIKSELDAKVRSRTVSFKPNAAENPMAYGISFHGHGIGPEGGWGYPYVLLSYGGGRTGRVMALHRHQRLFRTYDPDLDGLFLSNTWGDRSQDRRINDGFIRREIDWAERLGVEVVQIDDGWQRGKTQNWSEPGGIWEGFWAADAEFWDPNPRRFPEGLEPLAEEAKRRGISLGLWFAPDSSDDFCNWRRDAGRILELHQRLGVRHFKIDGVKARTRKGEENLRNLFHRVIHRTGGKVVLDLDVTAEARPGYFGTIGLGPIYVENRYSDYHRYWPHHTLRNLWRLSEYIDPLRLRMEFLNNERNAALYEGDPLAPSCYDPQYLFATVMFSSPLGWFEVSNLSEGYVARVARLVEVWKRHRRKIFGGLIIPIGDAPDGISWTGFASIPPSGRAGYLLLFREMSDMAEWSWHLEGFPGRCSLERLAGEGEARISDDRLVATIPRKLGFLFCRLDGG